MARAIAQVWCQEQPPPALCALRMEQHGAPASAHARRACYAFCPRLTARRAAKLGYRWTRVGATWRPLGAGASVALFIDGQVRACGRGPLLPLAARMRDSIAAVWVRANHERHYRVRNELDAQCGPVVRHVRGRDVWLLLGWGGGALGRNIEQNAQYLLCASGYIYSVQLYDRALTDSELSALTSKPHCDYALLSHLRSCHGRRAHGCAHRVAKRSAVCRTVELAFRRAHRQAQHQGASAHHPQPDGDAHGGANHRRTDVLAHRAPHGSPHRK
jgi:hypothetical protein